MTEQPKAEQQVGQDPLEAQNAKAEEAQEEQSDADPYEGGVPRAFPNPVDELAVPDTQYDQPADALGEGQVSADSLQQEREEFDANADDETGEPSSTQTTVVDDERPSAEETAAPQAAEQGTQTPRARRTAKKE